jgi:hypothetical protein
VRRTSAKSRSSAAGITRQIDAAWRQPLVRLAASGGLVLTLGAALALSPWLRVRQVTWTGSLQMDDARCAAVESQLLGRPLLLVPQAGLANRLGVDKSQLDIGFHAHLPGTLEVRVRPRRAVGQIGDGVAVDAGGRVLGADHCVPGLPRLEGFALDAKGKRLDARSRSLLAALEPFFAVPTLAPAAVRRGDDGQVDLVLADSGARVRLDAARAETQLLKLRVFEESLGAEPMPAAIDLRFLDQVVVRDGGGRDAKRRAR